MLLLCYRDSSSPAQRFWVTPGGGLEAGESYADAAVRELFEETGVVVGNVGEPIWTRQKVVDGVLFLEQHFLVRCDGFEVIVGENPDATEQALTLGMRFWSLEDLQASTETIYPEDLALHLEPILRGVIPATPLDITRANITARI